MTAADLNGDGKSDLAVVNDGSLSIFLSNGDGTFHSAAGYSADLSPSGIAIGDFNGDGKPDLAVADANAADTKGVGLSVLLGRGDGSFEATVSYETGTNTEPFSVAVGDFNGDGKPDVAVAYWLSDTNLFIGKVAVFLGKGDGTFQAAVSYDSSSTLQLAVGDVNGDGKLDLITVGGGVSVILGNGDGTFQPPVTYPGHRINAIALGDFNGDGKLDYVTTWSDDLGGIRATVWLNTSCSDGPKLAIERNADRITVSWPFPSAGYALESTGSRLPSGWKPAPLSASTNGTWQINLPTTGTQGYFRLRKM